MNTWCLISQLIHQVDIKYLLFNTKYGLPWKGLTNIIMFPYNITKQTSSYYVRAIFLHRSVCTSVSSLPVRIN